MTLSDEEAREMLNRLRNIEPAITHIQGTAENTAGAMTDVQRRLERIEAAVDAPSG